MNIKKSAIFFVLAISLFTACGENASAEIRETQTVSSESAAQETPGKNSESEAPTAGGIQTGTSSERSPIILISIFNSTAYGFDQNVYFLDSDGFYYNYQTYEETERIDINENNWYDKILEIDPISKDEYGEYYIRVSAETMKTAIDFSERLANYKDCPVKEYNDLAEYDSGISSVYGIYYDSDGIPQYVKLCSCGEQAECIDNEDVIDFVNQMSFTNDMRYIFCDGLQFPY